MSCDKLKNFPHVFYFTLDNEVKRQKYMEEQFKLYGITFTKISMPLGFPEYLKEKILDVHSELASERCLAYNYFLIDTLRNWYFETNESYVILMEDDYDLSFINHWHFSWDDLLTYLPYDWDSIQLGHECPDIVRFYLHPVQSNYSLGPVLLKREHVEKLLNLFYINGRYKFNGVVANSIYINRESGIGDNYFFNDLAGTPDYFLCQTGNTYTVPLIPCNPFFKGSTHVTEWYPMKSFICCYEAYKEWWENDKDNFSLNDFFSFGKSNDNLMERDIRRWDDKYFHQRAIEQHNKVISTL